MFKVIESDLELIGVVVVLHPVHVDLAGAFCGQPWVFQALVDRHPLSGNKRKHVYDKCSKSPRIKVQTH